MGNNTIRVAPGSGGTGAAVAIKGLSDLSGVLGRQSALAQSREQAEAERVERNAKEKRALDRQLSRDELAQSNVLASRAESARRFEIGQQHIADKAAAAQKKADGIEMGNRFFINANEGRGPKFKRDDYNDYFQNVFATKEKTWKDSENLNRKFLRDGKAEDLDTAVNAMATGKGTDADKVAAIKKLRKDNLNIVRKAALDARSPEERDEIIDNAMNDIYGERRAALNASIAGGSFMTNKQKANATMRYIPKEYLEAGGDASDMQRNLIAAMDGNTKQDLKNKETQRVKAINDTNEAAYKADVARYKAELNTRKGKDDWKGLTKLLEKDLGNLTGDNDEKAKIVDFMISKGVPHDRIIFATNRLISDGLWGLTVPNASDPKVVKAVTAITDELSAAGNLSKKIRLPKGYEVETPRNLNEIQRNMLNESTGMSGYNIRLREGWDKYKEKAVPKEILEPASADSSVKEVPAAPGSDDYVPTGTNASPDPMSVPHGSDYVPSKADLEHNRILESRKDPKFFSHDTRRAGKDAIRFINRLPANSATPALNLLKANNLGRNATLAVKNKSVRDKVAKEFADEAFEATKAAKKAAMNPTRQVVKPTTRSKSELRVDKARKKVWNNDKVSKETTDMWDNYWLANNAKG